MKSISLKEDWHGMKSTAQDVDTWTFPVTSSGVSVLGRAKLFLKGKVGVFYMKERSCWLLKPSIAVLAGHLQLHCAQTCPVQKLDAHLLPGGVCGVLKAFCVSAKD